MGPTSTKIKINKNKKLNQMPWRRNQTAKWFGGDIVFLIFSLLDSFSDLRKSDRRNSSE